jgi:hypothetical protein
MTPQELATLTSAVSALGTAINTQIAFTKQQEMATAEMEAYAEEHEKITENTKKLNASFKKLGNELLNISKEGMKFASTIGVSATRGMELEISNRLAVAKQLFNFNANLAVSVEQVKAAQQGFSEAFIGAAEGMKISSEGTVALVSDLKKGFKSEFEPTAETFRILTQMGMSTTEQFDAFRRATGRASISNNQLATLYNKNTLSFLLYGNSFAKAAVNAEKLGINLASVQAAQEGLVTNLDGTIDTVAQMNQLGASIDFGNLVRIAEQEGPAALMAYVRSTVPANMMQSASTRALFKQLGISVEDYLKSGQEQQSASQQLEQRMTAAADKTGGTTRAISILGAVVGRLQQVLTGSFLGLALSAYSAAAALSKTGATGALSMLSALGPWGIALGAVAAIGTSIYAANTAKTSDDMYSAGYGSRTLVTPTGAYALNNADDIIAGTKLFSKGSLNVGDNSGLEQKVSQLIDRLSTASTVINIDGSTQMVNRIGLSEVRMTRQQRA